MLDLETILEEVNGRLKKQGASIKSRQLRTFAAVIVEEMNRELDLIQQRLHLVEPE